MGTLKIAGLLLPAAALLLLAPEGPPLKRLLREADLVVLATAGQNEIAGAGNAPGLILRNTARVERSLKGEAPKQVTFTYVGYHPKLRINHLKEGERYVLILRRQGGGKADYALLDGDYGALPATGEWMRRAEQAVDALERPSGRVDRFAVVCCGCSRGSRIHREGYWASNRRIYRMLRDVYGYPDEAIFRLYEEGKAKDPAVDGRSTLENVRKVFAHLARIMRKDDHLFIVLAGHGGPHRGDYAYDLIGGKLSGREFDRMLDALPGPMISIALSPSSSGAILPRIRGVGRVICTSTSAGEDNAAPWASYFTGALAGRRDADADGDGRVSLKEAYDSALEGTKGWYEKRGRALGQHPLLDDDGERAARRFLGREGRKLAYADAAVRALRRLNARLSLR